MGEGGEEVWREECALESFLSFFKLWLVRRASEVGPSVGPALQRLCRCWPHAGPSRSPCCDTVPGSQGAMERAQARSRAELSWDPGTSTFSNDSERISCLNCSPLICNTNEDDQGT